MRYKDNTTQYWGGPNPPQCTDDYDAPSDLSNKATGLYGNNYQKISGQYSCKANTLNPGNWYNYPAATVGSDNHSVTAATEVPNSICPKGWRLPPSTGVGEDNKSYQSLIRTAYSISTTSSDLGILPDPLSFVRLGYYPSDTGNFTYRGYMGYYWQSTAAYSTHSRHMRFYTGGLYPQENYNRSYGMSIRCVSR